MISLEKEVEGDQIGSKNYRFSRIGSPVPIKPGSDSSFDTSSPPSRPLAISTRFRICFISHSQGFCVARVDQVKAVAKKLNVKEKLKNDEESGTEGSIQEVSIVDVEVGKVEILALSSDEAVLAAAVGNRIHFYAVSSLLHKEQKPSYSVSADDSNYIIDMRWAQLAAKEYVVLSHDGKLYQGCGQSPLKNIMDNVDAVEWSEKGDCVAVGRKNVLTIFSSEFKEKNSFLLSFKSVVSDSDMSSRIKVNCIRWVRSDCIMVGCLQLNDEGEEEDYLVQVITNEGGHIDDASAIPTVLAFYDIFLDYQVDVVPRASGPHLSLQYFDRQQIAFIANRKNLTQHVVLLGWGLSGKKKALAIEIQNDSWIPQIELQGNGDDNIILGLSIYQVLENDDVKYLIGEEETEVPPCCNLLCVTIDGKLSIFDFASAADALDSVEISDSHNEDGATLEVPSRQLSTEISTVWDDSEADTRATVASHISSRNELVNTEAPKAAISVQSLALFNQENKPLQDDHSLKGYKEPSSAQTTQNQDSEAHHTSYPWMQARNELLNTGAAKAAMSDQSSTLFNQEKQPLQYEQSLKRYEEQSSTQMTQTQERDSQQGLQVKKVGQASPQTISEAKSSTGFSRELFKDGPSPTISKMSLIGHSTKLPNKMVTTDARSGSFLSSSNAFGSPYQDPSYIKKADSSPINSFGRMPTSAAVNIRPSAALTQVPPQQKIGSGSFLVDPQKTYPTPSSTPVHKSKTNSLKQYQNIEEMVKKLDSLYEDIEGKGGFVDASVACQESSVAALEEKIWTTSRRCRDWKVTVDEQVSEMQDLLDKTVQVLSRKIYMEGIFKQACDARYWDLWNRQKLSSELELKRRHIDEANKELTNQLIELERHFNILELNRFGDSGGMDRRTSRKWHGQSRHIQSLQSLHTTTDAQLIAAEQLSENLFKQMAMLNIESPAKKQTIKKELFDTIGLSYDASSYSSAGKEKIPDTPLNKQLLSTASVATIERTKRHHDSLSKTHEPETARRRRDSLDQNWVNVAPPKTTVKRITLHEDQDSLHGNRSPFPLDRRHISTPLSRGMVDAHSKSSSFSQNHLKGKGIPDIRDQYGNRSSSSALSDWGNRVPSTMVSEVSSQAALPPSTSVGQIRAEMAGLANEKSGHVFPSKSTGSFILGESNPIRHSGENLHGAQFSSSRLPVQTKTVTDNSDTNTSFSYTKGSDSMGQMSSFPATSFSKGPLFPASNVNLDPKISWKVPDVASTNQSQHVEPASTDSSSLKGRDSSPAYLTSPPKQSEVTLFRGEIPNSNTSVAANQTTVESQGLTFPTTFSFLTPTSTVVSSTSVGQPTDMLSSKTEFVPLAKTPLASERLPSDASESGRIDTSETSLPSGSIRTVDNSSDVSGPQKDEASATQASSANANGNGFSTIAAAQKSEVFPVTAGSEKISELSQAALQQSSSLRSGSEANLGGTLNPPSDMLSNAKSVPHDVGLPSQSSTFGSFNSSVNTNLNIVTQEDEMDEEAPETSQVAELSTGFLQGFGSGFGSGSSPNPNSGHAVRNPFGPQMINPAPPPSSTFTMAASSGELFRPPSFSFSSLQPAQPSQSTGFGAFSGGFNGGNAGQPSPASGFGKPAQIGSGQQALGSVLGSFGQSRQLGGGLPGTGIASPGGFTTSPGGFGNGFGGVSSPGGGFSSLASGGGGGGFSNLASGVGGFAASASVPGGFAAAATSPGGFAAAATSPGGFTAAATSPGGFAAAATAPGGFAAAPTGGVFASSPNNGAPFSGGFGGFGGQQGGGGFSAFSGSSGTGRPSSELFTQIRK